MPKNKPGTSDFTDNSEKGTMEKVTGKAKQAGSELAEQASEAIRNTKDEAVHLLEEKKDTAVAQVRDLDQVLRQTAEKVDNPGLSKQITRLADSVQRVASSLETTDYEDVIHSLERFARSSPTVFLAGSFAVGLAASRFLRASSREIDDDDFDSPEGSYGTGSTYATAGGTSGYATGGTTNYGTGGTTGYGTGGTTRGTSKSGGTYDTQGSY